MAIYEGIHVDRLPNHPTKEKVVLPNQRMWLKEEEEDSKRKELRYQYLIKWNFAQVQVLIK